jgi:filamentous hemagglutinin family protein
MLTNNLSQPKTTELWVRSIAISLGLLSTLALSATAEITATSGAGSTGTTFATGATPNTIDIQGGQKSSDSKNLFHSFGTFNVDSGQIANFKPDAGIANILGTVTGGASLINGGIQVNGGSTATTVNLFLMNPAGIVFGKGASLDINGAFTATTAKAIDFNGKWFNAVGANSYKELNGNPIGFAFPGSTPGSIFSAATFDASTPADPLKKPTTKPGQSITLVGGTVISTGDIKTAGGNISIATVEGGKYVQIKADGSILRLDLPASAPNINPDAQAFKAVLLPQLLTATGVDLAATGVKNENGVVTLVGNPAAVAALIPDLDKAIAANNKAQADDDKARANLDKTQADYDKALAAASGNSELIDMAISNAFEVAKNVFSSSDIALFTSQSTLVDRQNTFDALKAVGDSKAISYAISAGDTVSKQNRSISSGDIIARNIDASSIGEKGGNIHIESNQAIFTGKVNTSSNLLDIPNPVPILKNGGDIILNAQNVIKTEGIDSSTINVGVFKFTASGETLVIRAKGGNVTLSNNVKGSDIIVDSIQTLAKAGLGDIEVAGGNLTITSAGLFRAIKTYDSTQVRTINTGPLGEIDINYKGSSFITGVTFTVSLAKDVRINLKPEFTFPDGVSGSRGTVSSLIKTNGSVGLVYTDAGFSTLDGSKRSLDKFRVKGTTDLPADPKDPSNSDKQASKPKSKENCTPSSTSIAANPTAAPTRSAGNANAVSADPCQQNVGVGGILQILTDRK